jgi:hypothetical protein
MMQTDVKSTACANAATTTVFNGPARVKGVTISYLSGGVVSIANNTSNVFVFTAPAAAGSINVLIPDAGIRCTGNVTANCVGATAVVFYG